MFILKFIVKYFNNIILIFILFLLFLIYNTYNKYNKYKISSFPINGAIGSIILNNDTNEITLLIFKDSKYKYNISNEFKHKILNDTLSVINAKNYYNKEIDDLTQKIEFKKKEIEKYNDILEKSNIKDNDLLRSTEEYTKLLNDFFELEDKLNKIKEIKNKN